MPNRLQAGSYTLNQGRQDYEGSLLLGNFSADFATLV
jgi:hypothetical protein